MSQLINNKTPIKIKSRKFNEEHVHNDLKKDTPYKGIIGTGRTSQKIRVAMWNVNGIRSVLNKKNSFYNFINQYNPDFICINQTKIDQEQFDKQPIIIKGYSGYWNFCKCSAGYSGVAVFSKYIPLTIFQDLDEASFSQEGRVLTLQYQYFYLVAVYIPSAGGKEMERLYYKTQKYEVAFQQYCERLKKKGKGVIVCGDLNVCSEQLDIHVTPNIHKTQGFTFQERKSFQNFLKLGWIDTFRKLNPTLRQYTWWRIQHGNRQRNIGKRLDYFLVNEDFFPVITKSIILGDVMGSDHCPILLEVNLGKLPDYKRPELQKKQSKEVEQVKQTKSNEQVKADEQSQTRPLQDPIKSTTAEEFNDIQQTQQAKVQVESKSTETFQVISKEQPSVSESQLSKLSTENTIKKHQQND